MRQTTPIDQVADAWVKRLAEISPIFATDIGFAGDETKLDDFSPEADERMVHERKTVLKGLLEHKPQDLQDEVTVHAMRNRLDLDQEFYEAKLSQRDLNNIASPAQGIRDIFDLMPTSTAEHWSNIAGRMNDVRNALAGYVETLSLGIERRDAPARRQVEQVITQVDEIAKADGFFRNFASGAKLNDPSEPNLTMPESLRKDLASAAESATTAYEEFGQFLRASLLPASTERDAIGRERYELFSRYFVGSKIDIDETYEWGIEELARVVAEQEAVARSIVPGGSVHDAIAALEADPARKLHGTAELQAWMQRKSDQAIAELGREHFDIAEPLRNLECCIAPTQSGGVYYTGPTDDFSRPGRMWWSVPEAVTEFGTWRELTTVYHEGVPGHHLQVGQAAYNRAELNSWRRLASWTSGHGEGWALYAERLMAELGYLDDPGDRLGMLDGQRMRAARVVLDIGVHCEKPRLDGTGKWDFEYALNFFRDNCHEADEMIQFEVNRYFGWPGQAPSYKLGERHWRQLVADTKAREGANFNLKNFHMKALNLGGIPLDTLAFAMSR